ncbi:peptidoglycan editing factor PgeF [bacterium]|nr:peptidoglycan editing factor PgeF [bacterium]
MYKIKKIENHTVYYSTKIEIEHFFTTRDMIVKNNLDLIVDYLKIPKENIIHPHQVHSSNIEYVTDKKEYQNCDALILDKKNYAIYLNFADCTPVILYDRKRKVAAVAHAGWRGTAAKIAAKTVIKMQSNPEDITALIGPCIGFECFETYPEALLELKNSVNNQEGLFRGNFADLKGINKRQLEEIGVLDFDIMPYCTVCDNDKFFSYRKENKTKNRHSALVKL